MVVAVVAIIYVVTKDLCRVKNFTLNLFSGLVPHSSGSLKGMYARRLSISRFSGLMFSAAVSGVGIGVNSDCVISCGYGGQLIPGVGDSNSALAVSRGGKTGCEEDAADRVAIAVPGNTTLGGLSFSANMNRMGLGSLASTSTRFSANVNSLCIASYDFTAYSISNKANGLDFRGYTFSRVSVSNNANGVAIASSRSLSNCVVSLSSNANSVAVGNGSCSSRCRMGRRTGGRLIVSSKLKSVIIGCWVGLFAFCYPWATTPCVQFLA